MKKNLALLAIAAVFCACANEKADPDVISSGEEITEFGASIPEVDSKTYLSAKDGSVWHTLWGNGDAININGISSIALSTGDGYVGTSYARFTMASAVSPTFYYAYPASKVSSYSKGGSTITVPTTQTWVSDQYDPNAYIMLGNGNSSQLTFHPVMGLVKITTTAPASGTLYVEKVRVEAIGSEKLSGTFTTNYSALSGGSSNYVDVVPASRQAFGTAFTAVIPAQTYADGLRITIFANTASSGAGTQKTMVFSKQSGITIVASTLTPITAPEFKESAITLACTFKTSSSLGLEWSGANAANNITKPWRLAVYSDSGCNTLVVQHDIPADPDGTGVWKDQGGTPRFIVGGLSQGTTYYCKVTDLLNGVSSVAAFNTESFTPVSASSPSGSTLVAEDFSEIGWGPAWLGGYAGHRYAGWAPEDAAHATNAISFAAPTGVVTEGYYQQYEFAVNNVNTNMDYSTVTRLRDGWGYSWEGGFNGYPQPGFLRMGGKNANRSFVVCPALSITEGKYATVDVTVVVTHSVNGDTSNNADFGVFKESGLTLSNATQRQYTGAVLNHAYPMVMSTYGYNKATLTFRVNGVKNTDHLVLGLYKNVKDYNRFFLFSVKVDRVGSEYNEEIFDITDAVSLDLFRSRVAGGATALKGNVINDIDASSIASSWTPIAGYTGTLSGNNKTITGLTKPFFADLQGDVEYLTLNSTINATTDTFEEGPAIFAEELAGGGSLDHCISQGSVTFQPSTAVTNSTRYVGGLVGVVTSGTVTNCSNAASVSFPHNSQTNDMIINVGGAIGAINSATAFSNVSNSGSVTVGVINATSTTREGRIGGVVGYIPNASSITGFNNSGAISFTGTIYGKLSIGGVVGRTQKAVSSSQNSGTITAGGAMNAGSSEYRYVGGIAGYVGANVALTNNTNTSTGTITNTGSSAGYTLIGGISGYPSGIVSGGSNAASVSYSGSSGNTVCVGGIAGRTVSDKTGTRINDVTNSGNISVSESSSHAGKTIFVSGISAHHQSGDVLAHNSGSITVENLHCDGVVVGALCGQAGKNSSNKASILSGSDNSAVGDISVSGITATNHCYVGGLVGRGYGSVTSASNAGDVEFTSSSGPKSVYIGGLVGLLENVSDNSMNGGHNSGAISNEVASGSGCDVSLGGLAGRSNVSISSSYNTGTVSNSGNSACDICIGGLVGNGSSITLTTCYNTGAVSNSGDAAADRIIAEGGLVGWSSSCTYASACYNTGSITNSGVGSNDGTGAAGTASDYSQVGVCVGGLVGLANGANTLTSTSSTYNYNNGAIRDNSSSEYVAVGGVCGYAGGAVSSFNYCRNQSAGTITISGDKTYIYYGGIAGAFGNSSTIDYVKNSGSIVASGATMAISGYLRLGGIIGGWTNDACTSQTINGSANEGSITLQPAGFGYSGEGDLQDSYVGGIAGGGNNSGVCGKALVNCKNSGAITLGSSNKLYHRFCVGGIIGFTDVNPTGSKCIANIRFRSDPPSGDGNNRVGGIAGEMMISSIHDVTYKGTVNTNGTTTGSGSPYYANYTGGLVGNVGTGTHTFTNCTVSGTMRGPNSTTKSAGIFFSCAGGGTGPTVNIESCTVGSGTQIQVHDNPVTYNCTISSASDITAANVCGTNGTKRTCTTGTNDGKSTVVDPSTITL